MRSSPYPVLSLLHLTAQLACYVPAKHTHPIIYHFWKKPNLHIILRILANYEAEITKNMQLLDILACNSANIPRLFVRFLKDGLLAEL